MASGPFTAEEAAAAGVSARRLHDLVRAGWVRQPFFGVYLRADVADDTHSRARAAAQVMPPHGVVVDRSAAALHGIEMFDLAENDVPPRLEVVSTGGQPSRRTGVFGGKRDLVPEEVMELGGVRVTTPLRTACDIACLRGRPRALATLDAFRTAFDIDEADLRAILPRYVGRRGVIQLREMIPLSRAGVDSPPESWIRLEIHDDGYPMPATQSSTFVPGWGMVRLENAYSSLRIAVEYDGEQHHSEAEDRARDSARRAALLAVGWRVIVVRRDGLSGPGRDRWIEEFRRAFADRAPYPLRKRVYARSLQQSRRGRKPR